jgi:hypothetical protein
MQAWSPFFVSSDRCDGLVTVARAYHHRTVTPKTPCFQGPVTVVTVVTVQPGYLLPCLLDAELASLVIALQTASERFGQALTTAAKSGSSGSALVAPQVALSVARSGRVCARVYALPRDSGIDRLVCDGDVTPEK